MLLVSVISADAQRKNDRDINRDIRDAVRSLNSEIEDFEYDLRFQMQSSSADRTSLARATDDIRVLRDNVRRFQDNYDRKRENREDVSAIVDAARRIEGFLQANPQNRRVQDKWMGVRAQINRLGANYGLNNRWDVEERAQNASDYPPAPSNAITIGISGTYELDLARSESVDDIIADARLGTEQREDMKDKLTAPGQIAIDIRGDQVTLATSNAAPVTFTADGRDKTERSPSGKTIKLRATLRGQQLIVSNLGGETDYTITFTSVSNGRGLKVSRRITTEYLSQTVFAESVYTKTDSVARLGIPANADGPDAAAASNSGYDPDGGYSDNDQPANRRTGQPAGGSSPYPRAAITKPGNYVVANGVVLTGVIENEINTGVSQNNDRFRMTVQSPDEYRGAVVEGYISNVTRSGKVTGQATVTLNFVTIALRDGKRYDLAGYVSDAKTVSGKTISVDNESTLKGDNQTTNTAKRGGIGAGIGAVIGAIAGGGKGAAIGAIIGAGGGAGSVVVQGREDVVLQVGSTISLISSSPIQSDVRDR
ncbi:hypothetical protein BH20ACI2_BH20ACI2_07220 [soil metagenome]